QARRRGARRHRVVLNAEAGGRAKAPERLETVNNHHSRQKKKKTTNAIVILTAISLCVLRNRHGELSDLMKDKTKTKHTIELEKIVNAPPAEVFKLWTSAEGVKKFFAPGAHIGTKPGVEYTILFFPKEDPEGL